MKINDHLSMLYFKKAPFFNDVGILLLSAALNETQL